MSPSVFISEDQIELNLVFNVVGERKTPGVGVGVGVVAVSIVFSATAAFARFPVFVQFLCKHRRCTVFNRFGIVDVLGIDQ